MPKEKNRRRGDVEYVERDRPLSDVEFNELLWRHLKDSQTIREQLRPEQKTVRVKIHKRRPFQILEISDIHFGSRVVDYALLRRIVDYVINTPGVFVILNGDLLDGIQLKYGDTIMADSALNGMEQFQAFKTLVLLPLAKAGLLVISGGFGGHEEWMAVDTQVSPGYILVDGTPVQTVENGGILEVEDLDEFVERYLVSHSPGKGGSVLDTVGGPRTLLNEVAENAKVSIAGHHHDRKGVAVEVAPDGTATVLVQGGGFKGTENKRIDRLNVKTRGGRASTPPGAGTLHYIGSNGEHIIHPVATLDENIHLLEAVTLWELANRRGVSKDMLEELKSKSKVHVVFDKTSSSGRCIDGDPTMYWKQASFNVTFDGIPLPVQVIPFNGLRGGSGSELWNLYRQRVASVGSDSHKFALFLREMIDEEAASNVDRRKILDGVLEIAAPIMNTISSETDAQTIYERFNILAWLNSGSLKTKAWTKRLLVEKGDTPEDSEYDEGLFPGDVISGALHVPMIEHESTIQLNMPRAAYTTFVLDGLRNSRSVIGNPFQGLTRMEQVWLNSRASRPHDVIVGGNGILAGGLEAWRARAARHQQYLATTWLASEHNAMGRKNRGAVATLEQSAIYLPGYAETYITTQESEATDLFEALTMLIGLRELGTYDQILRSLKSKSKQK